MDKLNLSFFGGADEVTGSRHLVEFGPHKIMLDCGLFQGHRHEALERNRHFPAAASDITCVMLSHAHIDHCGGLPLLVKNGFRGPIHCTKPTADLIKIMLMDSAFLQMEDAKFFNKIHAAEGLKIEPLYTLEDAEKTLEQVAPHAYDEVFEAAPAVRGRFLNAGHVLGSAMVELAIQTPKALRRILFTGDLGRRESLLMKPPALPAHVDYLLIETTYGGRRHQPLSEIEELMAGLIQRAFKDRGPILIPSFALERTQEIVYVLEKLRKENRIPPIHVYVDSPMAVNITEIFKRNMDCYCLSESFQNYAEEKGDPFGFSNIRYVKSVDESKLLNEKPGPKIIISASGMCEGGRILHHLRNHVSDQNTLIILVGYQAEGTLGRRLSEGARKVKIFGLQHDVHASVVQTHHFSSHADQDDLLWFVKGLSPRPQGIYLVHGDSTQRQAFSQVLNDHGINRVLLPRRGDRYQLT